MNATKKWFDGIVYTPGNKEFAELVSSTKNPVLDMGHDCYVSDGEYNPTLPNRVDNDNIAIVSKPYGDKDKWISNVCFVAGLLKDKGANYVELVTTYLPYSRKHRFNKNEGMNLKTMYRMFSITGIDMITGIDLHHHRSHETDDSWCIQDRSLTMAYSLKNAAIKEFDLFNPVLRSPDKGGSVTAELLGGDSYSKKRIDQFTVEMQGSGELIPVNGRDVICIDDMIGSGGTIVKIAKNVKEDGARKVIAACTHKAGIVNQLEMALGCEYIDGVVITNTTFPDRKIEDPELLKKLVYLDATPLMKYYLENRQKELPADFSVGLSNYTKLVFNQSLRAFS
jgi:ribose-phosphate pyrophosphokinase